jgi:flagellar hook assembly protein FlgD
MSGNIQINSNNHRVELKVDRQVDWRLNVKNNPFRSGSSAEIVLTPSAKGGNVDAIAYIKIYSNIGGIVVADTLKPDPNNGKLVYRWDGRNKQGRAVGTGTYLFRAVCESGEGGAKEKERVTKQTMIGVVRGGN